MNNVHIPTQPPEPVFEITMRGKRSWKKFKEIMKKRPDLYAMLDLRKASKNMTPLELQCCDTVINIKRIKDFPLEDVQCKQCDRYIIKWHNQTL